MKENNELRLALREAIGIYGSKYLALINKPGADEKDIKELLDSALSQIIDLMIKKLPEEECEYTSPFSEDYVNGFNQCLTQLKTILKGLK